MERKLAHSVLYDIKLCLKELFVSDALEWPVHLKHITFSFTENHHFKKKTPIKCRKGLKTCNITLSNITDYPFFFVSISTILLGPCIYA